MSGITICIPEKVYNNIECSICLAVIDAESMETLECGHPFHKSCIRRWANHQIPTFRCPCCNKEYNTCFFIPDPSNRISTFPSDLVILRQCGIMWLFIIIIFSTIVLAVKFL